MREERIPPNDDLDRESRRSWTEVEPDELRADSESTFWFESTSDSGSEVESYREGRELREEGVYFVRGLGM